MRPTSGVRYAIERADEGGGTTVYRGFAHLPEASLALEVRVEEPEGGRANVTAVVEGGADVDAMGLSKAASALVKAAVRAARDAERPLPRRIVRWRGV